MRRACLTALVAGGLVTAPLFFSPSLAAPAAVSWDKAKQGAFLTSLTQDKQGRLFVGTEDFGVWMRDTAGHWHQFNNRNSNLADNSVYALAVDKKGRVWAGTGRSGVSVFDGVQTWRNYNLLNGPLGERVFYIAVCPTDGDVWMATNAGLSRYVTAKGQWRHYSRANGLPSDQIQSLAFDAKGTLYAATQCDGLAIAQAADEYSKWRRVVAPSGLGTEPSGSGLASNNLNDVLVARDGTVYVASNFGLSQGKDNGATWTYLRGADYAGKVRERFIGAPKGWQPKTTALTEDYTTCLAQDASGKLWIGHRTRAYEVQDAPKANRVLDGADTKVDAASGDAGDYVTAILPLSNGTTWVARCGAGLTQAPQITSTTSSTQNTKTNIVSSSDVPLKALAFPAFDVSPTLAQLQAMTAIVQRKRAELPIGGAAFLDEDWRTLGDWVGRYGRGSTILCAMGSPFNHEFNRGTQYDSIIGQLGYNRTPDDRLRHFLTWRKSVDPRVIYDPMLGYRREAEWDDHGETYSMNANGPDLWVSVGVPEGTHQLSLYFFNKDGHDDNNRFRDYNVEVRAVREPLPPWPSALPGNVTDPGYAQAFEKMFVDYWDKRYELVKRAEKQPVLAQTRVRDFWGGVYKSFAARGPAKYWIKIDRNHSFNVILQSVLLQRLDSSWTDDPSMAWMGNVKDNPPDPDAPPAPDPFLLDKILTARGNKSSTRTPQTSSASTDAQTVEAARNLWKALDASYAKSGNEAWQWRYRAAAYRAAAKANAPAVLLANWRWKMAIWTPDDRKKWQMTMARAHWSLLDFTPALRDGNF